MKIRKTILTKGYTMIELMVTLFIFAIVTMFAVPAFFTFIEKSRVKTQLTQAASFLRSAQEIAIANNRTVYVFTAGLETYNGDTAEKRAEYWHQQWIMAFKPMGNSFNSDIKLQYTALANQDSLNQYIISRQSIFSRNTTYILSIIDSQFHNSVHRLNGIADTTAQPLIETEGYSKVRNAQTQGGSLGEPTFLVFYPSGEVVMPIFIISERVPATEQLPINNKDAPFKYDFTFTVAPSDDTKPINQWGTARGNFTNPIAIMAGCRIGRSLTVDSVNYTFNRNIIGLDYIFDGGVTNFSNVFGAAGNRGGFYGPPPSFGRFLCGSKFLR